MRCLSILTLHKIFHFLSAKYEDSSLRTFVSSWFPLSIALNAAIGSAGDGAPTPGCVHKRGGFIKWRMIDEAIGGLVARSLRAALPIQVPMGIRIALSVSIACRAQLSQSPSSARHSPHPLSPKTKKNEYKSQPPKTLC